MNHHPDSAWWQSHQAEQTLRNEAYILWNRFRRCNSQGSQKILIFWEEEQPPEKAQPDLYLASTLGELWRTAENDFAKSKQRQGKLDVFLAVFVICIYEWVQTPAPTNILFIFRACGRPSLSVVWGYPKGILFLFIAMPPRFRQSQSRHRRFYKGYSFRGKTVCPPSH